MVLKRLLILQMVLLIGLPILLTSCQTNGQKEQRITPTQEFTFNIYFVQGSMTTGNSIRGAVKNNKTGIEKSINWGYHEQSAVAGWVDESTVHINGITLNIHTDR